MITIRIPSRTALGKNVKILIHFIHDHQPSRIFCKVVHITYM